MLIQILTNNVLSYLAQHKIRFLYALYNTRQENHQVMNQNEIRKNQHRTWPARVQVVKTCNPPGFIPEKNMHLLILTRPGQNSKGTNPPGLNPGKTNTQTWPDRVHPVKEKNPPGFITGQKQFLQFLRKTIFKVYILCDSSKKCLGT